MALLEGLIQLSSAFPLLVAVLLLLLVYLHSTGVSNTEKGKAPPGPTPLPILGNLINLKKPYDSLCELSKKYGSVFTIYSGPKKVVVLAGYKTVKKALVNHAEEFGDREITPFSRDAFEGHGILFCNGENWREMRRFALTNLRNFGMGKRRGEEKIIEEAQHLIQMFQNFKGTAFDTKEPVNYAVSNIICAIVYGSRFEYNDPRFKVMVSRANDTIRLAGSPSVQLYNMFPWLKPLLRNVSHVLKNVADNLKDIQSYINNLQETLNPQDSRGFIDSFLTHQQSKELSSAFPLLVAVLLLLLVYLHSTGVSNTEKGKAPPGPTPLPILGNLINLQKPYDSLCELSKKYGSVFTIYSGPKKVVVLAGYKTVKQALVNHAEEFGNREITPLFCNAFEGHGIIFSNGENWREMRRFALTNLRNFGMGKRRGEEKIIEEAQHLIQVFEKLKGTTFDTNEPVNYAVSNIICAIVYGSRFEYDDPRLKVMVKRTNENIRLAGSPSVRLYNMLPWLKPLLRNVSYVLKNIADNLKEIQSYINNLQETLNPQDSRGFIDSFLIRRQSEEKLEQNANLFNEKNLLCCVANLFAAGTNTTGATVCWGLLLMAKYPHIQDRVQEEIDRVVGGRQPVVEDRKSLPYTDAVIHETQRVANIVPLNLPHATSCDVHFQGFFIEKGTIVIPLLTSVLRDESEWAKPYMFHPEHFLDDQGRLIKRDAFMPFSAGRRVCLGESLARMELFLFFTSLLQRFRFTAPPGVLEDELDLTPTLGGTLNPSPHKLCALSRS
ncbi:hypothetical protein ACEWY4_003072 [Coilia grayii]|uniref:Cytochrome P450 n=1 Tax=Coilia grayii TaxID=363190 RepID=A0ABD1KQU3_9TELE